MFKGVMRPHASILGYALIVIIYATQVWGGVFPFLPSDFQTEKVTLMFYLSQSIAFFLTFVAGTIGSYFFPSRGRRTPALWGCLSALLGAVLVIAALYLDGCVSWLVSVGGAALGLGMADMFIFCQRYFSSIPSQECNFRLIAGAGLGVVFYYLLHLVPIALTAFLVPVVFLPLCGLCMVLCIRETCYDQPMFEDIPRENPQVYAHLLRTTWRSALCVGALGLASGLSRGLAARSQGVIDSLNEISMAGMLVAVLVLLAMWLWTSSRFSLSTVFRFLYPLVITGLLVFPFAGDMGTGFFAGASYSAFMLAILIMMMQCAQISRERGTNPVFTYGFYGIVAYGLQSVGFLIGWLTDDMQIMGIGQASLLSALVAWVMGIVLFVTTIPSREARQVAFDDPESIEFVGRVSVRRPRGTDLGEPPAATRGSGAGAVPRVEDGRAPDGCAGDDGGESGQVRDGMAGPARLGDHLARCVGDGSGGVGDGRCGGGCSAGNQDHGERAPVLMDERMRTDACPVDGYVIQDRISLKCLALKKEHALSTRETEVMELIARGATVADIAQRLFISENTVRTHSKHIYTKLDIHSKQELGSLITATRV